MATSKARVEERRIGVGASFGVGREGEPGQWQGTHAPGRKEAWQAYQREQQLINERYAAEQAARTISGQYQAGSAGPSTRNVRVAYDAQSVSGPWGEVRQASRSEQIAYRAGRRIGRARAKSSAATVSLARVRVSAINFWVWGTVATFYLIQFVLGVMSTVALGMWYAAEFVSDSGGVTDLQDAPGFVSVVAGALSGVVSFLVNMVTTVASFLFGIDFEPYVFFMIGYSAVIFFGLLQLGTVWFMYWVNRIHSLSGDGVGAKSGTFLLALIGFCVPVLNIFPLIIFWTVAVWKYPK